MACSPVQVWFQYKPSFRSFCSKTMWHSILPSSTNMHTSRYVLYIWHTSCMECLTQASKPNLMFWQLLFWVLQSKSKRPYTKGKMVLILLVEQLLYTLQSWWALSPSQRVGFSLPVAPSIQPEKRTPNLSVIKTWKVTIMLQCIHANIIYNRALFLLSCHISIFQYI